MKNLHRARRQASAARRQAAASAMPRRLAGIALGTCALGMLILAASELAGRHGSLHLGWFEVVAAVLLGIAAAAILRR